MKRTGLLLVAVMLTGCASHQCWWGAEAMNPKCANPAEVKGPSTEGIYQLD